MNKCAIGLRYNPTKRLPYVDKMLGPDVIPELFEESNAVVNYNIQRYVKGLSLRNRVNKQLCH